MDGGPQFLNCWPETTRWASLTRHLASSRQSGRESSKKAEVIILCCLVKEVTSHHLFHNLLVTSKSQALALTRGDVISQGYEHQEIAIMRAVTEVAF